MTKNRKKSLLSRAVVPAVAMMATVLGGCVSPVAGPNGNYAAPMGGSPVTANPTPYTSALVCLGQYARMNNLATPRIAVGRIADYTGKEEIEGGPRLTQGASLMAMSAFAKVGATLVERFDTSVSELELRYANNRLIADDYGQAPYRQIMAGSIPGSDYYLVGGITELNFNIRSSGADLFFGDADATDPAGNLSGRLFVMNVGLDLRLVNTQTLEVVDVISYQKQIIGREIQAGYFDFFNNNVFDLSVGESGLEPMQLAVRSVIERAVLEMSANLYGVSGPDVCAFEDPLATNGATGDFIPSQATINSMETHNAVTRDDPNRWHERRDDSLSAWLRGQY